MTLSSTAAGEPRASLRERKKLATRRSLRRHALDLVAKRGFTNVTVEDIAEAADVSPRTFFNYFPSKEAALFGADPDRAASLRERLVQTAPGAPALEALRIVIAEDAQAVADELRELGDDPLDWLRRMKEARSDPHLRAAQAAQMALVERAATEGLAAAARRRPGPGPLPGPAGRHGRERVPGQHLVLGRVRRRGAADPVYRSGVPCARRRACQRTAHCATSPPPRRTRKDNH